MAAKNTFIWGDISDRIIGSMQTLCTVDIGEGMWGQCTINITKCIAVQLYLMLSGVILWKLKIPSSAESLQISRPCSRQAETQKIRVLSPVLFKSRNWKVSRISEIVSPNWICLNFPSLHFAHIMSTHAKRLNINFQLLQRKNSKIFHFCVLILFEYREPVPLSLVCWLWMMNQRHPFKIWRPLSNIENYSLRGNWNFCL